LAVLIPSILVAVFIIIFVGVIVYWRRKREQVDNFWKIDPDELHFDRPPRIIGRGSFGLVVRGEYRGTMVACKGLMVQEDSKNPRESALPEIVEFGSQVDKDRPRTSSADMIHTPSNSNVASDSDGKTGLSSISFHSVTVTARPDVSVSQKDSNPLKFCFGGSHRDVRQAFVEEIRILSTLRHPCICTIMGAVISERYEPILVMELAHFGSLHDLLHNDAVLLESHMLVEILHDITSGLRFLHSADPAIIHGDLKSSNVLIDEKFKAKVADFGCSYFHNSTENRSSSNKSPSRKNRARGTPLWLAPECLRGETGNTTESVSNYGWVFQLFTVKTLAFQCRIRAEIRLTMDALPFAIAL
jgi:serine/threonine protein kinase